MKDDIIGEIKNFIRVEVVKVNDSAPSNKDGSVVIRIHEYHKAFYEERELCPGDSLDLPLVVK